MQPARARPCRFSHAPATMSSERGGRVSRVMERSVAEVQLHDVLRTQDATLTAIVDAITRETRQQDIGGALYVEALGTQLAVQLLRRYAGVTFRDSVVRGRLSRSQVGRLLEYIEARLNEPISLDELATVA